MGGSRSGRPRSRSGGLGGRGRKTTLTICGGLARKQGGKGREGANEGRRKASVVQSCKSLELHEGKWQEHCIQGAS